MEIMYDGIPHGIMARSIDKDGTALYTEKAVLRSPFSVLRSPFSVLRSPFSVLRSPFSASLTSFCKKTVKIFHFLTVITGRRARRPLRGILHVIPEAERLAIRNTI
jgi:hypothetical protein